MNGLKLVIVESPAKASTIEGYLGPGYHVEASVGHIRDLPQPKDLPAKMRKGPYGRFSVNIEDGFTPYYMVNPDKKKKVTELKRALKEADELYLATDEDREGEAIAWHLREVLKPKVPVHRMVFHEITREAIERALENTRDVDSNLVFAQETRRILDRLYGYEVSPLLWRKIGGSLSAGRVQSVTTRIVVDRERERMSHVSAAYASIITHVSAQGELFEAKVVQVDGQPIASGSDFTEKGELSEKARKANVLHLSVDDATILARNIETASSSFVESVKQKPYRRRPAAPFTTSTLQQEASRKLHWNAASTMRTAQSLYESGFITYMRTDSTALSEQAIKAARSGARELYGEDSLSRTPNIYGKKSKGAQEAHEAIRPAGDHFRTPDEVRGLVSAQQLALYDLIWKRTVASQMDDAQGFTATIRVLTPLDEPSSAKEVISSASGTVITKPGFRLAYREGRDSARDDSEAQAARAASQKEKVLPDVHEGEEVNVEDAVPAGHDTQPPGRYTEATLVKTMEELGIGRPSTYAATVQTISDRGYVTHRGQYLVPTWVAFSVTRLLEQNLGYLVDYDFTASMEADLDKIAAGNENRDDFLTRFYLGLGSSGEGEKGLRDLVESLGDIDARATNTFEVSEGVNVRMGRYGPYLERADGKRANVPPEVAPAELDQAKIDELFALAAQDGRELGVDPTSGHMIIVKNGRFGPYVSEVLPDPDAPAGDEKAKEGNVVHDDGVKVNAVSAADTSADGATASSSKKAPAKKSATRKKKVAALKPRTASLLSTMDIATVTLDDALKLLELPREVGKDPSDGEAITVQNGRYGPYLMKGTESRSLSSEEQLFTITLDEALALYAQPKTRGRGTAKPPLREFGIDPISEKKVTVKDGRFGPYITDGVTNVTVPRAEAIEQLTEGRAFELLADKRAKGPASKKKAPAQKKVPAKKTVAKKKPAPAKKTTSRRSTAKKDNPKNNVGI